jgi:hypothetical protein
MASAENLGTLYAFCIMSGADQLFLFSVLGAL